MGKYRTAGRVRRKAQQWNCTYDFCIRSKCNSNPKKPDGFTIISIRASSFCGLWNNLHVKKWETAFVLGRDCRSLWYELLNSRDQRKGEERILSETLNCRFAHWDCVTEPTVEDINWRSRKRTFETFLTSSWALAVLSRLCLLLVLSAALRRVEEL